MQVENEGGRTSPPTAAVHPVTNKEPEDEMRPNGGLLLIQKCGCLGNKVRHQYVSTELNVNHTAGAQTVNF